MLQTLTATNIRDTNGSNKRSSASQLAVLRQAVQSLLRSQAGDADRSEFLLAVWQQLPYSHSLHVTMKRHLNALMQQAAAASKQLTAARLSSKLQHLETVVSPADSWQLLKGR